MSEVRLIHSRADEHAIYVWKNIVVCVWHGTASGEGVLALTRVAAAAPKQAGKHSIVHVVLPTCGLPDAEARRELSLLAQRFGHNVGCLVSVFEHEGFAASALRGLTTGILAFSSKAMTHRVVHNLAEAAAWLPEPHSRVTGVPITERELLAALTEMRAAVPSNTDGALRV